jgi:hypothetical protein
MGRCSATGRRLIVELNAAVALAMVVPDSIAVSNGLPTSSRAASSQSTRCCTRRAPTCCGAPAATPKPAAA